MRRLLTLGAVAAVAACLPSLAHAQWYAGLQAGGSYLQDASVSGSSENFSTEYQFGYGGVASGGYGFTPNSWGQWKVEGEVGYRTNEVNKATRSGSSNTGGSGTVSALDFMVNGLLEFMPKSKWHPYVGAGVGYAMVKADSVRNSGSALYSASGDWQLAYQGILGGSYDINNNWAVKADYRYFATTDATVSNFRAQPMTTDYRDHALMIGFTYKFGKPAPQAASAPPPKPAAAPAPVAAKTVAAAPVAAPVQNHFTVNFGLNSASLDGTAKGILAQAASAAKAGGVSRISLTGHADRSGSAAYNMDLSRRRAETVRDYMVAMGGLSAGQFAIYAKGETEPLVATRDGVREPRNRRVEIVMPGPSS
jgi:outer membrane protein OmpA-like peptidoglycan-associated protein